MTGPDRALSDPGRGGLKAVRWARFLQDRDAVHDAARSHGVVAGTYRAEELRTHGVGVVQLWPPSPPRNPRSVPRGIQAFQATTAPPAATLWAAATADDRITASVHVELVEDIARVCEAVDVQADGVGREYVLRLEPVATALARALDVVGFTPDGRDRLTRLRASFPWRWSADDTGRARPARMAEDQTRDLVVRFACAPGSSPRVADQRAAHCADVPAVPEAPTRAELAAVLDAFFTGGSTPG